MKSARIRSFSGPCYPAFGLNTERCGVSSQDILINGPLQNINPAKFQSIDEEIIRKAAIRTKGCLRPSGMDANGWRRILAPNNFWTENSDLRKEFTNVVRKLCTVLSETR